MVGAGRSLAEQYQRREQAIELVNMIGVYFARKRPDVAETCYHSMMRMRAANDALAWDMAHKGVE